MDSILQKLNGIPGVIGSLLCGGDGKVIAHAFPPLFDTDIMAGVSRALASYGVRSVAGSADLVEFRYGEGRVVIKPVHDASLVILCARRINMGVLAVSLNVAKGKLEPLISASLPETSHGVSPLSQMELGVCHIEDETRGSSFEQFGMAALTPATVRQISSFYGTGDFKRLKLTNGVRGTTGIFPVMIVNESDSSYDGKIILCSSIERKLNVEPGDRLLVEIA